MGLLKATVVYSEALWKGRRSVNLCSAIVLKGEQNCRCIPHSVGMEKRPECLGSEDDRECERSVDVRPKVGCVGCSGSTEG